MIVAFMLPEWLAGSSKDSVGFTRSKPFQGSQPSRGYDAGRHQHMDMIRHDYKGVKLVTVKPALAIANRFNYQRGDLWDAQAPGPGFCAIQDAVHRDERLAVG